MEEYTIKQTAEITGASPRSIQRDCKAGKFGHQAGREWRIKKCDLKKVEIRTVGWKKGRPRKNIGK